MTNEQVLTNARIVLPDDTIDGSLCMRGDEIADIGETGSRPPGAIDIGGDWLLPGLVDLHTDNLERHFAPRPGVTWPSLPAVLAHDAQIAAAGITTVFDALSAGDLNDDSVRVRSLSEMVGALRAARERGLLRVDHLTHLRCEVSHARVVEIFGRYVDSADIRLVSVMDHTPGQRQFTRMDKYKEYYQGKYGMTDEELERFTAEKLKRRERYSAPNRAAIVKECRRREIVLASHDDATPEHIDEAIGEGVALSEFPTTVEAAEKAHRAGLSVLMGAPNLVLGGSHSGNVSAMELARLGVLDALSSDYVPSSMLHAAFRLWQEGVEPELQDAVATVSAAPARIAGLHDRGEIRVGKRADLVRVAMSGDTPTVAAVWRGGTRIV